MVRKSVWNTVKLKDICDFIGGGTPSKQVVDFWHGNIPWISSSDLIESSIWKINITRHITPEAVAKSATHICPRNTILVVSRVGVGKVAIAPVEVCTSQDFTNLVSKKQDARFLAYCIQAKMKIMAEKTQGTSIKGVTVENVAQMEIRLPPREEQAAIAEALSDVDGLISSLQQLIEKKKAIKQGAMQEMLTGKKRLPGFYGEWKREQLPELLQEQNGIKIGPFGSQLRKEYLKNIGEFKVYGQENVYEKDFRLGTRYITKGRYLKLKSCELLSGDFVISSMGTVGKCAIVPPDIQSGIMDSHLIRLKFNCKKIVPQYMLQLFSDEFDFLRNQIGKLSVGGIMEGLSTKIVQSLNVFYPVNIDEQKAICVVLDDMDSEIEQLGKKLAKYQQIKQGMMQELLTGRIRLVDADGKEHPKPQAVQEKQPQPHNQYFDDAVMIAGIVNAFYSDRYPLGRKKVQKLLYLVRRKEQADISAFHKKAAGPYADEVRYKGGEPIAQKNKYIQVKRNEKGSCFEKGVQMQQALAYLQDWGKQADIDWLVSQFQYTNVNELELLATVDMAICDLRRDGKRISVASIKDLIHSNKEWRDKLKKAYFKDADIQRAIKKCQDLFES